MRVHFGQIYIQPGVTFPFSFHFQRRLADEVTALITPSASFIKKYGDDWGLMFRISAKRSIQGNEIRGPSVFRKDKDVEYTIFLPFEVITLEANWSQSALHFLLAGVYTILDTLSIDTLCLRERRESLMEGICSDATMFKSDWSHPKGTNA